MIMRAGLIILLGLGSAQAQDAAQTGPDMARLMQSLPEKTVKKLRNAPDAFLEEAAGLIYGFGAKGAIDAAGIDAFVAFEQARFRVREMARYLAADVNNDGDIDRAELAQLADAAPAGKRGRLQRGFDQADRDGNGVLTAVELRGFAQGLAVAEITDADVEALRELLMFDLDGNGFVAMEEVAAGVSALLQDA